MPRSAPLPTPAQLASLLAEEHRSHAPFHTLAPLRGGAALEDAYAVQDAFLEHLRARRGPSVGYKVGLTSKRMQALCGLTEPVAGSVLEQRVHASPAEIGLERHAHLGIESELCLTLADDLPPRAAPYSPTEIARALGSAAAAFELIDDRHADYSCLDAFTLIADNSWNEGVVLAPGRPVSGLDLAALAGTLQVDGARVDQGRSGDALESPVAVVAWLAAHLGRRGGGLKAGDFVMTGGIVPTRFAQPGQSYRFELEGLPAVELRIR